MTVNEWKERPYEVFLQIGKSGREDFAYSEAIGRLCSLCLRRGIDILDVIKHLEDISGADQVFDHGRLIKSVPDALAEILSQYYVLRPEQRESSGKFHELCPDCRSSNTEYVGNCLTCQSCGWSKC